MRRSILDLVVAAVLATLAPSCDREERPFQDLPARSDRPSAQPKTAFTPGPTMPPPPSTSSAGISGEEAALPGGRYPYQDNAWAINEGKRLFDWYNCNGCHGHGGGGIGPPLLDDKWIYGGEPPQIFSTIIEGRPNGMPSFHDRIPAQQVWQIVHYVRSMSGHVRLDAAPGRSDSLSPRPPESLKKEQPIVPDPARHP